MERSSKKSKSAKSSAKKRVLKPRAKAAKRTTHAKRKVHRKHAPSRSQSHPHRHRETYVETMSRLIGQPFFVAVAALVVVVIWSSYHGHFTSTNRDPASQQTQTKTPDFVPVHDQDQSSASGPLAPEFQEVKGMPLGARMDYWSAFLSKSDGQAELRELGSGPAIEDKAPLIPPRFDCTTFVETVAALSRSQNPNDYFSQVIAIRYHDRHSTFAGRNHFPEADWIPNNETAGVLKDITQKMAQMAGFQASFETKVIDRGTWLKKQTAMNRVDRAVASAMDPAWAQPFEVKLAYIPVNDVAKVAQYIPNGTVLNVVRKDSPKWPVLISHQGVVIQKNGRTFFRHASPTGSVHTVPLLTYLKNPQIHASASWPVVGVNLNQLAE